MGYYTFFRKGQKKKCYRCSSEDKLTDDHLPPVGIFPDNDRQGLQLITATICDDCKSLHGRSGEDDTDFICHMLLWKLMSSNGISIEQELQSRFKQSRLARGKTIVETETITIYLPAGGTANYTILKGGAEVMKRVLDNVARGIYYRMRDEVIPKDVSPIMEFKPTNNFNPPFNPLNYQNPCIVKKDVFEWKPILFQDDMTKTRFLCWEFKFYNLAPLPIYYSYTL